MRPVARLIPHLLTASRVAAALLLLVVPGRRARLGLLLWAALSDFLDGHLARRFRCQSAVGAGFDLAADGLFFLASFFAFWRDGTLPSVWFALILAASLPQLAAQGVILLRPKRRVGTLGQWWDKLLGGYSYACVIGLGLDLNATLLAAGQVALECAANGLDLWLTVRPPRGGRPAPVG
jgi:hypothetical protein